jgi:hypothetical protein
VHHLHPPGADAAQAILDGRQPESMYAGNAVDPLPASWGRQRMFLLVAQHGALEAARSSF